MWKVEIGVTFSTTQGIKNWTAQPFQEMERLTWLIDQIGGGTN